MGKESTCNAGDAGDVGSIPGWADPLEEGTAIHSSILAWRIPWSLVGYSLWGHKELDMTEATDHASIPFRPAKVTLINGILKGKVMDAIYYIWCCNTVDTWVYSLNILYYFCV